MSVRFGVLAIVIQSIVLYSATTAGAETKDLSVDISRFAAEIYQKCAEESIDKNIIISPISVATALALLSQGAQGKTFEQIAHGLHLGANKTAIANGFATKTDLLKNNVGQSTLSIANKIYLDQQCKINEALREVAVDKFKSGIDIVDFNDGKTAAETMNSFVAEKTNNKIKDLFDPTSNFKDTKLVIVNAIYFKGKWKVDFPKAATNPDNFYLDTMKLITVDFMRKEGNYRYAQLDDLKASAVELEYDKSSISFMAVLPNSRNGLSALEASLVNYDLSKITKQMNYDIVDIKLPKFKINYEIKLNNVLQKMGMTDMFEHSADLSGLLASGSQLKVSEVIHKAFIDVNEEGSEAAAATGMRVIYYSANPKPPPPPKEFHADHPFMYYIFDRNTNTVLFSGRCIKDDDKVPIYY